MTPPARCMHLRLENATWHPLLTLSRNESWLVHIYVCVYVRACCWNRYHPFFLCLSVFDTSHSSLHRLQHAIERRQIEKFRALRFMKIRIRILYTLAIRLRASRTCIWFDLRSSCMFDVHRKWWFVHALFLFLSHSNSISLCFSFVRASVRIQSKINTTELGDALLYGYNFFRFVLLFNSPIQMTGRKNFDTQTQIHTHTPTYTHTHICMYVCMYAIEC